MTDREAMQQALGYMESVGQMDMHPEEWAIAVALRERLAQPERELVCVCGAIWEGQELVSTPPQRKPDHIGDTNKMVPFQDLAAELFVVAQISPADDGFSDTITRIEAWLRNHFSTPPQRKPLTDAVLAEREACAQLCETKHFSSPIREAGAKICAAAIRARGKT